MLKTIELIHAMLQRIEEKSIRVLLNDEDDVKGGVYFEDQVLASANQQGVSYLQHRAQNGKKELTNQQTNTHTHTHTHTHARTHARMHARTNFFVPQFLLINNMNEGIHNSCVAIQN